MAKALSRRVPDPVELVWVFDDDEAEIGDKWQVAVAASFAGDVVTIHLLQEGITHERKSAIFLLMREKGYREIRWCHTNNNGHTVEASFIL
jgi:hypothetical protein